jgi:hypothetical protein
MNLLFPFLTLLAVFSAVEAHANEDLLDVPRWLDHCAALSDTRIALEMDRRCLASAYDYCEIGRLKEEREPCILELNQHLQSQVGVLVARLPDRIDELGVFRRRSYERDLERLRNGERKTDCDQLTKLMCETTEIALQWSEARRLARTAGLLEKRDLE